MQRDAEKFRDQAAEPVLLRISNDRKRVSERLKPVLDLIKKDLFRHGFDVNTLWRKTGLRKGTASPRFTRELGVTPGIYLISCRMPVAARLLAATSINIKDVAELVGYFRDSDAFSNTFKAWCEQLPSEYRLVHQGQESLDREPDTWLDQVRALGLGSEVTQLIERVEQADATDDLDGARHGLARIDAIFLGRKIKNLSARLALVRHECGALLIRAGHVDQAHDHLAIAASSYAEAGDLPPEILQWRRKFAVEPDTREALHSALCPECRTSLAGDQGGTVRKHLSRALEPVPRDLQWFGVCCDECYRVVWQAISRARLGLMDDAWKAWWLSANADLDDRATPPSRGRFIAALAEVERRVGGDQLERKGYCDLAVDDAIALEDPLLEAEARIWRASVLRALGQFADGREELGKTAETSRLTPWLTALQDRMAGILENDTNHRQKALELFRSATALYETLDPHIGGLLLVQQAHVHFYLAKYENSVDFNEKALSFMDARRDPMPVEVGVPIQLASAFALLGNWDKAEAALGRCCFGKAADHGVAVTEVLTHACLELLRGRSRVSLSLFVEAKERAEKLHRPLDVALAASYSVEAYARVGDRAGAIESAAAAHSFFQAAGCTEDSLVALGKLRALLEAEVIDVSAITANVRRLARQYGGWLPEPSKA